MCGIPGRTEIGRPYQPRLIMGDFKIGLAHADRPGASLAKTPAIDFEKTIFAIGTDFVEQRKYRGALAAVVTDERKPVGKSPGAGTQRHGLKRINARPELREFRRTAIRGRIDGLGRI